MSCGVDPCQSSKFSSSFKALKSERLSESSSTLTSRGVEIESIRDVSTSSSVGKRLNDSLEARKVVSIRSKSWISNPLFLEPEPLQFEQRPLLDRSHIILFLKIFSSFSLTITSTFQSIPHTASSSMLLLPDAI